MKIKQFILVTLFCVLTLFILLLYWSVNSTDKIYTKSVIYNIDNVETTNFRNYDSIELMPSDLYKADEIKKIFQGEQYRAAWSAKVKVPIVFLDTLKGGMTILKEGGGMQTHSLKLKGADGITYTLRSVNKDAEALIPEFLKTLNLENVVVDGISAQHPFAAILVAELAEKANLLHTSPQMVFVPKQKELEKYNDAYGNRLYLLEYETESDINYTKYDNIIKIVETEDLQEMKLTLKDSLKIDVPTLIRSRLFDMLIGDWDRHTKQWGWAIKKTDSVYSAIPIAGDRDNAFFNLEGVIPSILSHKDVVKELRPFNEDIDYIEGYIYPFDRYFLLNTPLDNFLQEAEALQMLLTDDAIDQSLHVWPKTIQDLDAETIVRKIKSRRNDVKTYAAKFHSIIQQQGKVTEPLKGSEDITLPEDLLSCFECYQ
ncbi:hypothetical protein [Winogradskyella pulchriflava]|uniref:Uncharacterized protein n=1 Tax=Winogradskyella pulchriflava TaxID=1110688 RepID=A0ABV6Q812_9FLAO